MTARAASTDVPRVGVGVVCLRPSRLLQGSTEVLMIQRGKEPDKGRWSFPGGRLELGETIVGCAVREFKEETGLRLRCDTACVPAERSHEGVPVVVSNALHTPMAFSAADAVTRDNAGNVLFHYAIIEVAGVAEDPDAPVKASDDAADARWVDVSELDRMEFVLNTKTIAVEAVNRFEIR
eukprot:CAMPEP_0177759010 /NCGR_PEP_ID=MMETSP0491_2-20121128/4497_1 /TAXON_ID=63592 /ORGANISM="Tetraselmis chuii, Strain PLY429" /LENGTH=179 /DNA_ID=CAMNT_0019274797 /DNA_START=290 /DNA_END=829 /DNA_ORIENTATION=-